MFNQCSRMMTCMYMDMAIQETQSTAAIYGGSASAVWVDFTPPLINDPQVCTEASEAAEHLGAAVVADCALSLSGDNFTEFQLHVSGAYSCLDIGNPEMPNTLISNHNSNVFFKIHIDKRFALCYYTINLQDRLVIKMMEVPMNTHRKQIIVNTACCSCCLFQTDGRLIVLRAAA